LLVVTMEQPCASLRLASHLASTPINTRKHPSYFVLIP
jgi:hypothetical protein